MHFLFDTSDDFGDFKFIRYARPRHLPFSINTVREWASFVNTGKVLSTVWKSMKGKDKDSLQWLQLGEERTLIPEPFTKYTNFWDSLGLDEPRALPPPGEIRKKVLRRKQMAWRNLPGRPSEEEPVTEGDLEGFVYVDLESDGN